MNRFKGGPALKVPQILVDLYGDLRDRRLLPLVGLLIAGIIAAPILLDVGAEKPLTTTATPPAQTADAASFSVVPATPELRDYRERLAGRQARNPFTPHVSASEGDPNEGAESVEPEAGGGSGGGAPEAGAAPEGPSTDGGSSTEPPTEGGFSEQYFFSWAVDLRAGMVGNVHARKAVRPLTRLPSADNPIVVFMGFGHPKGKAKIGKPLFLLTSRVNSYAGPATCAVDKLNCQLLEVAPGVPMDFAFGANNDHYRLTVEGRVLIATDEEGHKTFHRSKG